MQEALRGKISIRKLRVMLEHLPLDNAVARELHGRWGDQMLLTHDISSSLRILITQQNNLYRAKGEQPAEPELIPVPDAMAPESVQVTDPERIQAEKDHLQMVLARSNPH